MTKLNLRILNRAFSVNQPFAEQIMLGKKKFEYRSVKTKRRTRVYDCTVNSVDGYQWHLANPKRFLKPVKPDNKGQPVWFIPFKK